MRRIVPKNTRISAPVETGIRKNTGPPRIIGKRESSAKIEYSKKWNTVLLKEAKSSSDEFKQRMNTSNEVHLKRYLSSFLFMPFIYYDREGLAIDNMSVELRGSLFEEQIISFFRSDRNGGREVLPFNRFQQGDVIIVSKSSPVKDAVLECVVMQRNLETILVTTKDTLPSGFTHTRWVTYYLFILFIYLNNLISLFIYYILIYIKLS